MAPITKEQIEILVELQTIETERFQLQRRLEKEPDKLRILDEDLAARGGVLEAEEMGLADLKKDYRTCEADLQINGERIKKLQERLRSVKTNREYQATLKEIDDLKAKNSAIEDRMIEALDRLEDSDRQMTEKKAELDRFAAQTREEKAVIEQEIAEARARLEVLEEQRKQTAGGLDAGLMRTYQRIRARGVTVAIAPVVSAVCQGCNMNIPPQMFNELQRFDSLKLCPFCERII
ncbi:MAG: C4-type zinc ribbon domain-containing protein, partial [Desulfobacterales bacterium]